jgi:glycosyltransferase involved in cell wall biosynthesis
MECELLRRDLADPHRTKVVHYAVDTARFGPVERDASDAFALLYAGSLVRHKGVHTLLEALALFAPRLRPGEISLTIAGAGHPDYENELREAVLKHGLAPFVRFTGAVPYASMPRLLQDFDALVFPSLWEEPLAASMLEAMSSGLLVIGTRTGGSGEILVDGETGLVFPAGDAAALAARIEEARSDRAAAARLAARARQVVVDHFDLTRMVNEIEDELAGMVSGSTTLL